MTNSSDSDFNIELMPASNCPMCDGAGEMTVTGAVDSFAHLPGEYSYRRCFACRTVWMDPAPTPASIPHLYPTNYYTHASAEQPRRRSFGNRVREQIIARHFAYPPDPTDTLPVKAAARVLGWSRYFRHHCGFYVRYCPFRPGGRLLDVGCGNGVLMEQMGSRGWIVEGIEPDPQAYRAAVALGYPVHLGTAEDFPIPSEQYDAIVLTDVLEHTLLPRVVLSRLYGSLRPGGRVVCVYPNADSGYARRFGKYWESLDPPRHLVFPSPASLQRLFSGLGARTTLFSLSRYGRAVIHQSENLRERGPLRRYEHRPRAEVTFARCVLAVRGLFDRYGGGEVVCIAEKP